MARWRQDLKWMFLSAAAAAGGKEAKKQQSWADMHRPHVIKQQQMDMKQTRTTTYMCHTPGQNQNQKQCNDCCVLSVSDKIIFLDHFREPTACPLGGGWALWTNSATLVSWGFPSNFNSIDSSKGIAKVFNSASIWQGRRRSNSHSSSQHKNA